jgi:hypothetical protein
VDESNCFEQNLSSSAQITGRCGDSPVRVRTGEPPRTALCPRSERILRVSIRIMV